MKATQPAYFTAYRSLRLSRDAQGVLLVEFHTKGGPLTFTAQDHTEFVDAFYRTELCRLKIFGGDTGFYYLVLTMHRPDSTPEHLRKRKTISPALLHVRTRTQASNREEKHNDPY